MKLAVRDVSVTYGGTAPVALSQVSISLGEQEQVALIGPSGSGKSTLLSVLGVARIPSAGQLLLEDQDPWQLASAKLQGLRSQLHLCPQSTALPARQRVVVSVLSGLLPKRSLLFALRSLLSPARADVQLVRGLLTKLDMEQCLWRSVETLSGGQRQRVAIARAMAADVSTLLVDEPLSALDPTTAELCLGVLVEHAMERQQALVCSLHQIELARKCLKRIIGLRAGKIMFDLPATSVSDKMIEELYRGHEAEIQT